MRCAERPPCAAGRQAYTREHGLGMPIEVEARDLGEVREVLQLMAGDAAVRVDRIMLDNMAHLDPAAPSACPSHWNRLQGLACWIEALGHHPAVHA